jgi:hypothetical protein
MRCLEGELTCQEVSERLAQLTLLRKAANGRTTAASMLPWASQVAAGGAEARPPARKGYVQV